MAEEEVSYASVVFRSDQHPPTQARKEEETVYDEVKEKSNTSEETADTNAGLLLTKTVNNRFCNVQYQRLACCLGILCVILLSVIIAVVVVYHQNKIPNLTTQNQQLETQNQQLETQNQQLETQRNNLTEQIRDLETNWNKLNVSRAQWSIDAYCPKTTNVRQCKPCQEGWLLRDSNCYVYHDAAPPDQKTWEEARQNCRGKGSDLVVVHSQAEKDALNEYSKGSSGTDGYWFGLRAEGGRWKWIDGSYLTESYWTPQPPPPPPATDGQCVMSVKNVGWISVSCGDRKQWICIMKALSV
ncbi:C-type lectin domain family 12 member B-like isoform X2 [Etheostoma cragini]|uniref:C-type lectin domain family 12 member B-like isoform X2 n=1 Tax=Etheostoma cragini TaxID=417921 RepID=UPI00155DF3D7|nr:C-type lectin domain family 12 member B-like isoform X2 [Etheostoma cragini]